MAKVPVVKFADTAYDISWTTGDGLTGAIITLFDADDRILFKIAFDDAAELLSRLPVFDKGRGRHRIIYDYAVEKGVIRNPNAKDNPKEAA